MRRIASIFTAEIAENMPTDIGTALRDISELLEDGILRKDAGGGRSTSYSLAGTG
jgi:Fic family protein